MCGYNDCDDELLLLLLLLLPPFSLFFFWALASSLFFFFFGETQDKGERGVHISLSSTIVFTEDEKVALLKSRVLLFVVVREHFLKAASPPRKKATRPFDEKKKERSKTHRPFLHSGDLYSNLFFPFFHAPRRAQKKRRREDEKEETFCSCLCLRLRLLRRERERERERDLHSFFFLFFFSAVEKERRLTFLRLAASAKTLREKTTTTMELPRGARPPPDEYFASEFNVINNDRGGEETARVVMRPRSGRCEASYRPRIAHRVGRYANRDVRPEESEEESPAEIDADAENAAKTDERRVHGDVNERVLL